MYPWFEAGPGNIRLTFRTNRIETLQIFSSGFPHKCTAKHSIPILSTFFFLSQTKPNQYETTQRTMSMNGHESITILLKSEHHHHHHKKISEHQNIIFSESIIRNIFNKTYSNFYWDPKEPDSLQTHVSVFFPSPFLFLELPSFCDFRFCFNFNRSISILVSSFMILFHPGPLVGLIFNFLTSNIIYPFAKVIYRTWHFVWYPNPKQISEHVLTYERLNIRARTNFRK